LFSEACKEDAGGADNITASAETDTVRPAASPSSNPASRKHTMLNHLKSGVAIASAAAALFAAGTALSTPAQAAEDGGVKCAGLNSCKGTSECATAQSQCKGQNSCKGQGWVSKKSAAECTSAGGTVLK
jgi:hypothetical protein